MNHTDHPFERTSFNLSVNKKTEKVEANVLCRSTLGYKESTIIHIDLSYTVEIKSFKLVNSRH